MKLSLDGVRKSCLFLVFRKLIFQTHHCLIHSQDLFSPILISKSFEPGVDGVLVESRAKGIKHGSDLNLVKSSGVIRIIVLQHSAPELLTKGLVW
ncbi:hypothetical protein KCU99_g284, partial [Aureobasidium melanogenum]